MTEPPQTQLNVRPGTVEEALARGEALLEENAAAALQQAHVLLRGMNDPQFFRLAAKAHRRLDESDNAVAAELAGVQSSFANPHLEAAAIARQEGRIAESKRLAERVLADEPDDLLALTIAAEAAISLKQFEDADDKLARVLDRAPTYLRASLLQSQSLAMQARLREAIAVLDGVLARKPDNAPALREMATLRAQANDHDAAVDAYRRLLSVDENHGETWIAYAQYLRILGQRSESEAAFRRAIEIDPGQGAAWWGLAQFFPETLTEQDEQAMRRVTVELPGTPTDEAPARVALSIVEERRGNHAAAFEEIAKAKSLRFKSQPYKPDLLSAEVDESIRAFAPDVFRRKVGAADDLPIFIVGMPRSGSTLVERILGQHSAIEAAGELQTLPKIVDLLRARAGPRRSYAELATQLAADEISAVGRSYVERAGECRHTDAPRFIDKFNLNWLHSGLIRLILPNARILDVRRDPLDCCWSNFKMMFADGHANDLRHLGRFYRDYVRMMDHVDDVAPNGILRVQYEELVGDVEASTRRMLQFLDLPFEQECVDFHRSSKPVATPSSEQVRQPINRKGIGSAEPYRQWLGPLIEELGDLAG